MNGLEWRGGQKKEPESSTARQTLKYLMNHARSKRSINIYTSQEMTYMNRLFKKKWLVVCIALFCSVLWGSAFPVLKLSYEEIQMAPDDTIAKLVFAGMRFLLAGLIILIGLFIFNRRHLFVTKRQFLFLIILGIIQTGLQYYFFYNGLAKVSGMQGAIL